MFARVVAGSDFIWHDPYTVVARMSLPLSLRLDLVIIGRESHVDGDLVRVCGGDAPLFD